MEWLQKLMNIRKTHRTENTASLDEKFDPSWEYRIQGTIGKSEKEGVGAFYLAMAKQAGYFIAIPRNSPKKNHHLPENQGFIFTRNNEAYIDEMVQEGFLARETVPGGVKVISPTEKLALRMYGHDRVGNTPRTRQLSREELEGMPIGRLVRQLYVD